MGYIRLVSGVIVVGCDLFFWDWSFRDFGCFVVLTELSVWAFLVLVDLVVFVFDLLDFRFVRMRYRVFVVGIRQNFGWVW